MSAVVNLTDYKNTTKGQQCMSGGYTKLPNWIADTPMSANERAILLQICRLTIGWSRSSASIAISEFMESSELSKNTVLRTLKKLTNKGWIFAGKTNGGRSSKNSYSVAKNPRPNGATDEQFNGINGATDEQFCNPETVPQMNTRGATDEQFNGINGATDEHAKIKKDIKENYKENIKGKSQPKKQPHNCKKSWNANAQIFEGTNAPTSLKKAAPETQATLPENLNKQAWFEFVQHRADIKKSLTPLATKKLHNLLTQFDVDTQQDMIDQTISNRWTGIFPPKAGITANRQTAAVSQTIRPTVENI